jgi:hypothetical protein
LGDLGVEAWIILKYIFEKQDVGGWTALTWLRIGTAKGFM